MGVFDGFRQAPPSASGRSSHDVLLGLADAAVTGLWALSGSIRRVTAPATKRPEVSRFSAAESLRWWRIRRRSASRAPAIPLTA
jgi:hypothetical protein